MTKTLRRMALGSIIMLICLSGLPVSARPVHADLSPTLCVNRDSGWTVRNLHSDNAAGSKRIGTTDGISWMIGCAPATVLTSTAAVASTVEDQDSGVHGDNVSTTSADGADISILKSVTSDSVMRGHDLTYLITVNNEGPADAENATLIDLLPPHTIFQTITVPSGWNCATPAVGSAGTVTCSQPLMPLGSPEFELVARVDLATPKGTAIQNTATIESTTPDPNPGAESATSLASTVFLPPPVAFLPSVYMDESVGPDLVVDRLVATTQGITVTIRNAGNEAVVDSFWVDVYCDPSDTPPVNEPWPHLSAQGVAWGVTLLLGAGQPLTLTVGASYFAADYSSHPPFPVGANVYALVDSVDFSSSDGAVIETHEQNNLKGPIVSTSSATGAGMLAIDPGAPGRTRALPHR